MLAISSTETKMNCSLCEIGQFVVKNVLICPSLFVFCSARHEKRNFGPRSTVRSSPKCFLLLPIVKWPRRDDLPEEMALNAMELCATVMQTSNYSNEVRSATENMPSSSANQVARTLFPFVLLPRRQFLSLGQTLSARSLGYCNVGILSNCYPMLAEVEPLECAQPFNVADFDEMPTTKLPATQPFSHSLVSS